MNDEKDIAVSNAYTTKENEFEIWQVKQRKEEIKALMGGIVGAIVLIYAYFDGWF